MRRNSQEQEQDAPPAYHFSQEEFDNKLSVALKASVDTSSARTDGDEEEWEEWDEALFEAKAREHAQSEAGSSKKLNVEEKKAASPLSKGRDPVHTRGHSSLGSFSGWDPDTGNAWSSGSGAALNRRRSRESLGSAHSEECPPPFSAVDGVDDRDVVRLSYDPSGVEPPPTQYDTIPPFNITIPTRNAASSPASRPLPIPPPPSLFAPPATSALIPPPRPTSVSSRITPTFKHRIQFDPSVAYNNYREPAKDAPLPELMIDPSRLYNAAVSPYVKPRQPDIRRPTSYAPSLLESDRASTYSRRSG